MAEMRAASLCAGVLTLLLAGPGGAVSVPDPLESGGEAEVVAVIDGDTLVLDDGREVRLVGTQAPKLSLGRPGFEAWPLADEAKQALEALVLGQRVALGYGGLRTDQKTIAFVGSPATPPKPSDGPNLPV